MSKVVLVALALLMAALIGVPQAALAQEAPWRISAREGNVRLRYGVEAPREARLNEVLRPGTVLTTGAKSTATVENGAQRMVMSANSRMTTLGRENSGMSRIFIDLGSTLFQVDRQGVRHFRVETPRLAAVVKGTVFSVNVSPEADWVSVKSGLVEVRANRGGATRDAATAQTIRVTRTAPSELAMVEGVNGDVAKNAMSPLQTDGGPPDDPSASDGAETVSGGSNGGMFGFLSQVSRSSSSREGSLLAKYILIYFLGGLAIGAVIFISTRIVEALNESNPRRARKARYYDI